MSEVCHHCGFDLPGTTANYCPFCGVALKDDCEHDYRMAKDGTHQTCLTCGFIQYLTTGGEAA